MQVKLELVPLPVSDVDRAIAEARAELVRGGVEIGEIQDFGGGVQGADFSDPDGNTLELQEMAWRKGAKY